MAQVHRCTLIFRDLDVELIMRQYAQGEFSKSSLSQLQPSTVVCGAVNLLRDNHSTNCSTFKGIHNSKVSIFNIDQNSNDHCQLECFWDQHPFDNEPVGLPISMASELRIDDQGQEYKHYLFETRFCFCSMECMYAFFCSFKNSNNQQQWIMQSSERFIQQMFDLLFPGKKLQQATHWLYLDKRTGHLSIKQFRQDHNEYYPTHKISLIKISNEYIKTEISK